MSCQLYTYALIRSMFEAGKDYIDTFLPFALNGLPVDGHSISVENIQTSILSDFNLDIPIHTLNTILTRAKRNGYAKQNRRLYSITEKGKEYRNIIESVHEVKRRINEFYDDANSFLKTKHDLEFDLSQIEELINTFINEHLEFFEEFINPSETSFKKTDNFEDKRFYEAALIDYLKDVERRKPSIFKTLQDIVFGSIISVIIKGLNISEATKNFGRTIIYVDTNFAFSLLGLHYEEINKPVQELNALLSKYNNIELRIFDFTIEEMSRVLGHYELDYYKYSPNIKIGSIFSSLRSKRWSVAKVREYIINIEDELQKSGLMVENTKIDIYKYDIPEDIDKAIEKFKPNRSKASKSHDAAAIEYIKEARKTPIRIIEKCKMLFLTSDIKLARANYLGMHHQEHGTICEVIPDRLLTNILWIKNPSQLKSIQLHSIISMHSNHLFVDKEVWKMFFDMLIELRDSGDIDKKQISYLFQENHLQSILMKINPNKCHELINKEWFDQQVEKAKDKYEKEKYELSEGVRNELMEKYENELKKISTDRRNQIEDIYKAIKDSKKRYRSEASAYANNIVTAIGAIVGIVIGGLIYLLLPKIISNWDLIEPITWAASIFAGILIFLVRFKPTSLRDRIIKYIEEKSYRKRLGKSDIQKLKFMIIGNEIELEDVSRSSSDGRSK